LAVPPCRMTDRTAALRAKREPSVWMVRKRTALPEPGSPATSLSGRPDAAAVTLHMGVNSRHAVGRVLAREPGSDYAVLGEAR
jgi:hypothetical protein